MIKIIRFPHPVQDIDGKTVYGLKNNKPIYNPDFGWPKNLRRKDDTWVCGKTDEVRTHEI